MGDTNIEWTDKVWNPVTGCSKVSAGCKNCFAERIFHRPYPGRDFTDVRCHEDRLELPCRWHKPQRIFVNSISDLFHKDVPDLFIYKVLAIIAGTPRHTFQLLTKRPVRMAAFFSKFKDQAGAADLLGAHTDDDGNVPDGWDFDEDFKCYVHNSVSGACGTAGVGWPMKNLWLGVSVEDQATADDRIPLLMQTPAAVRWISAEPLLAPISLRWMAAWPENAPTTAMNPYNGGRTNEFDGLRRLDWVVVGGESGPKARPMEAEWAQTLMQQCKAAEVPFFFKQGSAANWPDYKKFESFPRDLQVREYPCRP